jgi:hypothetical protein
MSDLFHNTLHFFHGIYRVRVQALISDTKTNKKLRLGDKIEFP